MEQDTQLLPVMKLDGTEYLVDVANRLFREFKNPENSINMHSEKGSNMLREIIGRGWACHGMFRPAALNQVV